LYAARRFSFIGIVSVGTLLATGLVNSWHLLDGVGALVTTAYGRLLSLKIALFAIMVAIASVNRLRHTPRLPTADASSALLRNSLVEIVLGFAVIAIVGALGTMAPHDHVHHMARMTRPDTGVKH
ncbi:MAG: CopD family protein, partial [Candidatus Binataceae bacterium]